MSIRILKLNTTLQEVQVNNKLYTQKEYLPSGHSKDIKNLERQTTSNP